MANLQTLEQRLRVLETRVAEIEGGYGDSYGDSLYHLRRDVIGVRLDLSGLLTQAGLTPASDDQIDRVLDEQG